MTCYVSSGTLNPTHSLTISAVAELFVLFVFRFGGGNDVINKTPK